MQTRGLPNRQSIRLKGYDYASQGAYFLTFCTYRFQHFFGEVLKGKMELSDAGKIVMEEWLKSVEIRDELSLGEWVIMPNHLHGIVHLSGAGDQSANAQAGAIGQGPQAGAIGQGPQAGAIGRSPVLPAGPRPKSIGAFMAGFKSAVTVRLNARDSTPGRKIWHRNYWDSIIWTEEDYHRIEQYIRSNPQHWEQDRFRNQNKG